MLRPLAAHIMISKALRTKDITKLKTNLFTGLGLLQTLSNFFTWNIRWLGVEGIGRRALETTVFPRVTSQIGRIVGLGWVGKDIEG